MEGLQSTNFLTVIGSFGQGKSSLVQHVALRLRDEEGYDIIPCRNPMEIVTWYQRGENQIFIVDDLYGESCLLSAKLESWQDHANFLEHIFNQGRIKIIASSRPNIFNVAYSKLQNKQFQSTIIMNKFPLTNVQKENMLKTHIQTLEESEIKSILEIDDEDILEHFPLLCLMYNHYSSTLSKKVDVHDFFRNRNRLHDEFLENLRKHDKNSYKTILIFVLLNGQVSQNEYSNGERLQKKVDKLSALTNYLAIEKNTFYKCLENLTGTYFKKSRGMFLPIHNTILVTLLEFTARVSQQIIIQHWNSGLLFNYSHFKSIDLFVFRHNQIISVNPGNENLFFQRMIDNIQKRKSFKVFEQDNMKSMVFRQKFIKFIRTESSKDDRLIKRILNTIDDAKVEGSLPLLPIQIASFMGLADMVELLVSYVDVNFYGIVGFSALHAACTIGDINTVKVLIDNNADVNKTVCLEHVLSAIDRATLTQRCLTTEQIIYIPEKSELSPIYIACLLNHKSIVELLLKNGASMQIDPIITAKCLTRMPLFFQLDRWINYPGNMLILMAFNNMDFDMVSLLLHYQARAFEIPLD